MPVSTFGVTYTDIESALQGWDLSDKTTEMAAVIRRKASKWNGLLVKVGIVPADVATEDTLYALSQDYIIERAAAAVGRMFTRQDPELSKQRDKSAVGVWEEFAEAPEAYYDAWDTNEQTGSFRSNEVLTPRVPGSSTTFPPTGLEVF